MSPRTGRPPKGKQTRTQKITIRISDQEAQKIQECADSRDSTRTDAIVAGIDLLKMEGPRTLGIHIRVTPAEKEDIMAYCDESGVTCREFLHLGIETHKQKKIQADKEK